MFVDFGVGFLGGRGQGSQECQTGSACAFPNLVGAYTVVLVARSGKRGVFNCSLFQCQKLHAATLTNVEISHLLDGAGFVLPQESFNAGIWVMEALPVILSMSRRKHG